MAQEVQVRLCHQIYEVTEVILPRTPMMIFMMTQMTSGMG